MNKLLVICFLLISFLGFGQSVSAPDSKSFIQSTNGQDGSGFTLNGFNSTDVLLTSISLVNPPSGTTFYLGTTTGLTAASGFTLTGNKTRLVVTGTMANINTALASLKINTGSVKGNVLLSVAATVNPTGYFYNGVNGHFYRPISTGTTYTNARTAALNTTFKGQQGYLVTITSSDEDAFIYNNVPQSQIWFALTDEVVEGQWRIDAGPEKGTLIKTSNGQLNGNIVGQYNNWAGGEPNNSGNEDYAVTKWNGTQWNDLPNGFNCPYVIEYGTWSNPDDATFTEFYTNSVSHSNGEVLTAKFNIDFGGNVDETKFSAKANTYVNNVWGTTTNTSRAISGLGKVDLTNDLDTTKINGNGVNVLTSIGQVEWCVIYQYDTYNQRYRIGIDSREVNGILSDPSTITNLQLFDLWNGPVTFNSYDPNGWTEVYVYTSTQFNFSGSSFVSNIRNGGSYYALTAEFTFSSNRNYKQHGIDIIANNQTELNTLYNSIVSVTDVYLAFKELSNGGLFGNESGLEFTSGIQYMNADVDGNGVFNEADTYKLLQHLTGVAPLTQYSALTYLMKLYSKTEYDGITKSNWNTQFNSTRSLYPFSLNTNTLNNTYNLNVTWVGDINLSHSAKQTVNSVASNSIRTMSLTTQSVSNQIETYLMSENVGGKLIVTISLDPLQQEVVGTQFNINYDNTSLKFEKVEFVTKGNPTNFGTDRGSSVTLGSLITDGSTTLDKTTEYKITFLPLIGLNGTLGLTSISNTDAVNKNGTQLKIKIN
jgi:Lectin C-type domain